MFINPNEHKAKQEETKLTQKSVTNVSHTHHTHYNFHDKDDGGKNSSPNVSPLFHILTSIRYKAEIGLLNP